MPEALKPGMVFRNTSSHGYYLSPRAGSLDPYFFPAGATMEAVDEKEAALLASMSGIVDVAKEAPQLATAQERLRQEVLEARKENDTLRARNAELEKQLAAKNKGGLRK